MQLTLSTLAVLLVAGPAVAQPASTAPADSKQAAPDRIVCERYEEIGSRLASRKVCRTVREWEKERGRQRSSGQDNRQKTAPLQPDEPRPTS